jgi:hypothetical protein
MTCVGDREHDLGTVFREPSKNEEGPLGSVPLEAAEEGIDAVRDPAGMGQPIIPSHDRLQCFDLKVFLDVYGEEVRGLDLC